MNEDKFYFFWGGFCSQWYPSKFTIDGVEYNCAEQYMMAQKALTFGDQEAHDAIMASQSPMTQKKIGREVRNFDVNKWNEVCRDIVFKGNYAKFTQNDDLYTELMETTDKEIVEASPYDIIWGIGLDEFDPNRFDKSKWRGTNWLGEEIMKVRDRLAKELGER